MFNAKLLTRKGIKHLSMGEWIEKVRYIYTMQYCLGIKMYEVLPFEKAWMKPKNITLEKVNINEQISNNFTQVWNLKQLSP